MASFFAPVSGKNKFSDSEKTTSRAAAFGLWAIVGLGVVVLLGAVFASVVHGRSPNPQKVAATGLTTTSTTQSLGNPGGTGSVDSTMPAGSPETTLTTLPPSVEAKSITRGSTTTTTIRQNVNTQPVNNSVTTTVNNPTPTTINFVATPSPTTSAPLPVETTTTQPVVSVPPTIATVPPRPVTTTTLELTIN